MCTVPIESIEQEYGVSLDTDQLLPRYRDPGDLSQIESGLFPCDDTPSVGLVGEFGDQEAFAVADRRLGPGSTQRSCPCIQESLDRVQIVRLVAGYSVGG